MELWICDQKPLLLHLLASLVKSSSLVPAPHVPSTGIGARLGEEPRPVNVHFLWGYFLQKLSTSKERRWNRLLACVLVLCTSHIPISRQNFFFLPRSCLIVLLHAMSCILLMMFCVDWVVDLVFKILNYCYRRMIYKIVILKFWNFIPIATLQVQRDTPPSSGVLEQNSLAHAYVAGITLKLFIIVCLFALLLHYFTHIIFDRTDLRIQDAESHIAAQRRKHKDKLKLWVCTLF